MNEVTAHSYSSAPAHLLSFFFNSIKLLYTAVVLQMLLEIFSSVGLSGWLVGKIAVYIICSDFPAML